MNTDKIKELINEYSDTKLIEGSPATYFFYFWLTKALSFTRRSIPLLGTFFYRIFTLVKPLFPKYFVIQNTSGRFAISHEPDDATTICSGYFESNLRRWIGLPNRKELFLDIGANRGIYTILALTHYGYKNVIAFEPNPEMFSTLSRNVGLNDIQEKVELVQTGLGEKNESLKLSVDSLHAGGGRIFEDQGTQRAADGTEKIEFPVNIRLLDDILSLEDISRISFIKIDTEGFEDKILRGATKTISSLESGTLLMIETPKPEVIEPLLKSLGMTLIEQIESDYLYRKN